MSNPKRTFRMSNKDWLKVKRLVGMSQRKNITDGDVVRALVERASSPLLMPDKKTGIRDMGLDALMDYFDVDVAILADLPPEVLHHLKMKARLGMQFEKEMGLQERCKERTSLRVLTLVAEDQDELKMLIKKSFPEYL